MASGESFVDRLLREARIFMVSEFQTHWRKMRIGINRFENPA